MKKRIVSIIIILTIILIAPFCFTQNEDTKKKKQPPQRTKIPGKPLNIEPGQRKWGPRRQGAGQAPDRTRRARGMMLQERVKREQQNFDKKKKGHENFINELKTIKKQAEDENAEKTVKLLDKLINRKTKEFAKTAKKFEDSLKRLKEQVKKREENAKARKKVKESGDKPKPRRVRPRPKPEEN